MPGSFHTPHAASANLVGSFIFYTLLGTYTCVFVTTIIILRSKRATMSPSIAAIVALFVLALAQAVIGVIQLYQAYISHPGGPQQYYDLLVNFEIDQSIAILSNVFFSLSTVVADAMLLWRLYIVWDRNRYVLVFPALAYLLCLPATLGVIVCSIIFTIYGPNPHVGFYYHYLTALGVGGATFLCWYSTAMTCGKLWSMRKQLMKYSQRPTPYAHIVVVLVESSVLYSASFVVFLWFYCNSPSFWGYACTILINVCSITVGLSPTLVVLRLALGHRQPSDAVDGFSMPQLEHREENKRNKDTTAGPATDLLIDDGPWASATVEESADRSSQGTNSDAEDSWMDQFIEAWRAKDGANVLVSDVDEVA